MAAALTPDQAYEKLKERFRLLSGLTGASSILYMDSMTAMRPGSDSDRSEQMMALASAGHMLVSAPVVADWLDQAESGRASFAPGDNMNLSLMRRSWTISTALPEALVREKTRLETEGNNLHTVHRDSGNWAAMKPIYQKAFALSRERAQIIKEKLGFTSAYEALLDEFSPGLRLATVEREFAVLEKVLPLMLAEAQERQAGQGQALPLGDVPVAQQKKLSIALARSLGFNEDKGILYSGNMHPLSGGTPDDSRMTTAYYKQDVLKGLYTTAHEAGHSLYEQATPAAWRYQPAGHTMGMDIHESQSMVIQFHACMIPEFIDYLAGQTQTFFKRPGDPALQVSNLAKHLFQVQPSFIRVNADELTYPAHIILRFNLEKALIEGALDIDDLPDAWNEGMQKSLGIIPPHPGKGHMQDVHWPTLSIGYFPAYTLGAMGAAQFFAAAVKAQPQIPAEIGRGHFGTLRHWLRQHVHEQGSLLTSDQLFVNATGEPLNTRFYLSHLSRRYLGRDYQP